MRNFGFRSLVCCGVAFIVAISSIARADYLTKQKEVLKWVENCSEDHIVFTYEYKEDLVIHEILLGPERGKFIHCLLPKVAKDLGVSKGSVFFFDSPIVHDHGVEWDPGEPGQIPVRHAHLQTDKKDIIVTSPGSDYGIEKITHVSRDIFVIQTSYSTHIRTYLLWGDRGEVDYLTNGDVEVIDADKLTFRVKGYKTYFRCGDPCRNSKGAFWINAVIDRHGKFLDILYTPSKVGFDICMSRDELIQKSYLDLSRVVRQEVCIWRMPGMSPNP